MLNHAVKLIGYMLITKTFIDNELYSRTQYVKVPLSSRVEKYLLFLSS